MVKKTGLSLGGRISLAAAAMTGRVRELLPGVSTMNAVNSRVFEGTSYTAARKSKPQILEAYLASPWLRAVVGKLYDAFTSVEWGVYGVASGGKYIEAKHLARGAWETRKLPPGAQLMKVEAHPYYNGVSRGASLMSAADLYGMTQVLLELCGECFWWKLRDERGLPSAFLLIPPLWCQEIPGQNGRDTFLVQFPNRLVEIQPQDMVWFKVPVPVNPYGRGQGMAGVVSDEIEADEYAAKHVKSWFLNRARPDVVVSVDARTQPERDALEASWKAKFEGFRRSHRVLFTNKGTEIKEISQSFQEMELTNVRKFERDVVLQTWGWPPELFGVLANSNRATVNAAEYLFAKWILVPRLEYMRKVIQTQVIEEYDPRLVLGFSSVVAKDREFEHNVRKAQPWAWTLDEWRAAVGDPPLPDGAGNVIIIPAKYRAVEATLDGMQALLAAPVDDSPDADDDKEKDDASDAN